MKKIIALLLALIMTFSVATIAFAADETVDAPSTEETTAPAEGEEGEEGEFDLGDFGFIMDLPLWTLKPMLKVAKIALKLVKVVVKVGAVFGMDPGEIVEAITALIAKTENGGANGEVETTAPEVTPAIA